jgi:hypothetical protein
MQPLVSSQQTYFFNQNGYIEFESVFSSEECDELAAHAKAVFLARLKRDPTKISETQLYENGRDLWRQQNPLKLLFVSRKMGSLALGLSNKNTLRLACDQWVPKLFKWSGPTKIKDLFSIQGMACAFLIRMTAPLEGETINATFRLEPGLIPLPAKKGNALIVHPNLLLNFPKLALCAPTDLYIVAYSFPTAVYVHNPADPCNSQLKAMGYNFGDCLINQHHPLIQG